MCIQPTLTAANNGQQPSLDYLPKKGEDDHHSDATSEGLKECEEHEPRRKKFKNFVGIHRPMGIMEKQEYQAIYRFWLSFWKNSFLGHGIENIYDGEGRAQFRARVNMLGDLVVVFALALIIESSRHFGLAQIAMAAFAGYYLAALCFGFCHMSVHARALDYHWLGSQYAIYIFAYIHHRTHESADTFTNQVLMSLFPSVRRQGRMWYEFFKYGTLAYVCATSEHTRLLVGWFLLSWIMEGASHQHSHGHSRSLPPLCQWVITRIYGPLGLVPTKEHHHTHHDDSYDTRVTNFTDLHAPLVDYLLNHLWDAAYHTFYSQGQLHDTAFSLYQSWFVFAGHFIGYSLTWALTKSVGVNATSFCWFLAVFFHLAGPPTIFLVRLYKKTALFYQKGAVEKKQH